MADGEQTVHEVHAQPPHDQYNNPAAGTGFNGKRTLFRRRVPCPQDQLWVKRRTHRPDTIKVGLRLQAFTVPPARSHAQQPPAAHWVAEHSPARPLWPWIGSIRPSVHAVRAPVVWFDAQAGDASSNGGPAVVSQRANHQHCCAARQHQKTQASNITFD